ncbi:MAG: LUD domain-containing protein [Candidatus Aenigmarchaeota archaeon]|nr:LUD domain-containing protein [Candidatus Aenigmarchaeota archaeon]MDW8160106.1 LUD domain-containing protein [Candidatus Aenigmarchaeota archaeon]
MELSEILQKRKNSKRFFKKAYYTYISRRREILRDLDLNELKKTIRRIREDSIKNVFELKEKAVENLEKNGVKVFEAKDSKEALRILEKIIPEGELLVKSKSNVIKEIGFEERFYKRNKVVETDCGDFIVQICGESSSHPVTPALHIPLEKVVKAIRRRFRVRLKPEPEEIVSFVKNYIRRKIFEAKYGLTGANVITSDGFIVIIENEGNISLVSKIPNKHIIVASIDKIVKNLDDAILISKVLSFYGTGSKSTSYINIISSLSKTADLQKKIVYGVHGPEEVYLVLVDNGRSKIVNTDLEEILYCIGCGACLYSCPIYRQVFERYGKDYIGGIGVLKTFMIEGIEQTFNSGLYFCNLCGSCKEVCPVSLDVPEIVRKIREISVKSGYETKTNSEMVENVEIFGNPFGKSSKNGEVQEKLYCC